MDRQNFNVTIHISNFILIFLLFTISSFSQDNSSIQGKENTLSRNRLMFGYSAFVSKYESPELRHWFMNLNYRTSDFHKFVKPLSFGGTLELGVNISFPAERGWDVVFFLPYIKAGPELSLFKNVFISGNAGIAAPYLYTLVFFGGLNMSYLIPVSESYLIEIEYGVHTSWFHGNLYLIYFTTGFAID